MKPSITPEELVRLQNLAERLFSHINRISKKRREYYVSTLAPLILGDLPATLVYRPPMASRKPDVVALEDALECIQWAAGWGVGPFQPIQGVSATTFALNACETHLDKFDSLI